MQVLRGNETGSSLDTPKPATYEEASKRARALFGGDEQAIEFCLADWPEGAEHWDWLANASSEDVRDWVAAGVA